MYYAFGIHLWREEVVSFFIEPKILQVFWDTGSAMCMYRVLTKYTYLVHALRFCFMRILV